MTSVDNTAVLQDLRNKREQEAEELKKELQKERDEHETMLQTMRNKYQVRGDVIKLHLSFN
jgi:hypothetical protein